MNDVTGRPLPDGWRWVRLAEVVREAQGGFACGERDPGGVIQLRMNNVTSWGTFDWPSFIRVPADSSTVAAYQLQPGDVLFNNTNSTELVGKTALFKTHTEPVVFSNHFTRLRSIHDILSPHYLTLWLQSQWQQRVFENICNRWIGQSAVQRDKLLALEILLPPLPEQQRIVSILSEQMEAVERARAAAQARLEAAKALPAAYLRAVFNSSEAQQWPRKRLGEVLRLRNEVVHPYDNPTGQATFVGLEHIESGTGKRIGCVEVEKGKLTGRKPQFTMGDIVYGYLRPYLNKVWLADFDGLCSVDQYVYLVDPTMATAEFIAWFMRSPVYLARAPIGSTPGQLPRIRTEEVSSVEVNLPPLSEQRGIVAMLAELMATAERACGALQEELATISKLPAALLRRAFEGGL
jgi:type I restriction enzyme S subunit